MLRTWVIAFGPIFQSPWFGDQLPGILKSEMTFELGIERDY